MAFAAHISKFLFYFWVLPGGCLEFHLPHTFLSFHFCGNGHFIYQVVVDVVIP